jgi:hypothetical protein
MWSIAPGYVWANKDPDDLQVKWVPGRPHPDYIDVVASATENSWEPAPGHKWINPGVPGFATEWDDAHKKFISDMTALAATMSPEEFKDACVRGALAAGAGAAAGAASGGGAQGAIIGGMAGCLQSDNCVTCVKEVAKKCEEKLKEKTKNTPAEPAHTPPQGHNDFKDWKSDGGKPYAGGDVDTDRFGGVA